MAKKQRPDATPGDGLPARIKRETIARAYRSWRERGLPWWSLPAIMLLGAGLAMLSWPFWIRVATAVLLAFAIQVLDIALVRRIRERYPRPEPPEVGRFQWKYGSAPLDRKDGVLGDEPGAILPPSFNQE